MIIGSKLVWVLNNAGLRETKIATVKERKPIQAWVPEAIWLHISWAALCRGPIKAAFQKLYWGGRETRMSILSHLPVVKDDRPGALFSLSYHGLAPSSLLENLLSRKSEVCRTDLRPGTQGQLFQVQQVLSLFCWLKRRTKVWK